MLRKVSRLISSKLWFPWQSKSSIYWCPEDLRQTCRENQDRHKISVEFDFGPNHIFRFGVIPPCAKKKFPSIYNGKKCCPGDSIFIFDRIFQTCKRQIPARSDHSLRGYLSLCTEKHHFDLVRSKACAVFYVVRSLV